MSSTINDPRHWLTFVPDNLKASALYTTLWKHLKDDPELLELVALVDTNQPIPITFFTTVNYLVLAEPLDPLALYYPYLHPSLPPDEAPPLPEAYHYFRAFVLAHREKLQALLPEARLQTNEPTRCSNLLPAFFLAYQRGGYQPLNMIEVGSSAGFNLRWHRYHYWYTSELTTEDLQVGESLSPVHLHCTLQGPYLPPLPEMALPPVASCQGIELCPRDIRSEQDMRWVRAAIWPEERKRHEVLDAAIQFAGQTPALLHQGDASALLPTLLEAIPKDQTAVIWHSYAIEQGPVEVKDCILQHIREASHRIPIYRVSLEFLGTAGPKLELMKYDKGELVEADHLANCVVHGECMAWLQPL
jgi:hypothetical protein